MTDPVPLGDLRISELLELIGSSAVSPGAGVAGAVALALAAACARKAASVSLKHRADDSELRRVQVTLEDIERDALVGGERDAEAFSGLIHERSRAAVERLICEEERLGYLIARLTFAIDAVAPRIQAAMTGDIVAAKALVSAAQRIRDSNEGETLELR
jgi:hypothetical protein